VILSEGALPVVQVLSTITVLSAIGMAANLRIQSLVTAFAVQATMVAIVILTLGWEARSREVMAVAGLVFVVKAIAVPSSMRKALRASRIPVPRDTEPYLSLPSSVVVCAGLAVLGYASGRPIVHAMHLPTEDVLPAGLTLALVGAFLMIVRGTAMTQAVGLMVIGNGILLASVAAAPVMPILPELGLAFEALVALVVVGMSIFGINRTFDKLRLARLGNVPARRRGKEPWTRR
jgi:hydrogenase-4 component E